MKKHEKPGMEVVDIKNDVILTSGCSPINTIVCTSETCVGGDCADFCLDGGVCSAVQGR